MELISLIILSSQGQRQGFGHELCHTLRHEGNQLIMPPLFRELQEMHAKRFAYKFCIPTFMPRKIKEIQPYNNFTNEIAALLMLHMNSLSNDS